MQDFNKIPLFAFDPLGDTEMNCVYFSFRRVQQVAVELLTSAVKRVHNSSRTWNVHSTVNAFELGGNQITMKRTEGQEGHNTFWHDDRNAFASSTSEVMKTNNLGSNRRRSETISFEIVGSIEINSFVARFQRSNVL